MIDSLTLEQMASLSERLYILRHEHRWTLEQLSQESSVPVQTISRIERGITEDPGINTVRALARALGVRLDYLTGDVNRRK